MTGQPKEWQTYEEVATYLLSQMADQFGLERVEGKQKLLGLRSGTEWEIDAKGIADEGSKFLIVECRRHTGSRLDQESVGALAYRIDDSGASGGILVSPLGLQEGAQKVAQAENIISVTLGPNSSSTDYVLKFLDQIKVGMSGEVTFKSTLGIKMIQKDGTVDDLGCV